MIIIPVKFMQEATYSPEMSLVNFQPLHTFFTATFDFTLFTLLLFLRNHTFFYSLDIVVKIFSFWQGIHKLSYCLFSLTLILLLYVVLMHTFFNDSVVEGEEVPDTVPPLLLKFAREIAAGMNYLATKGFVHRDVRSSQEYTGD